MNNNPYAAAYHNMRAIEQQEQERAVIENMPLRQVIMQFIPGPDRRRYNNPTGNEVEAIFVGDDGAPLMYRDIVVYPVASALREMRRLEEEQRKRERQEEEKRLRDAALQQQQKQLEEELATLSNMADHVNQKMGSLQQDSSSSATNAPVSSDAGGVDLDNLFSFLTEIPTEKSFFDDIGQEMSSLADNVQEETRAVWSILCCHPSQPLTVLCALLQLDALSRSAESRSRTPKDVPARPPSPGLPPPPPPLTNGTLPSPPPPITESPPSFPLPPPIEDEPRPIKEELPPPPLVSGSSLRLKSAITASASGYPLLPPY
ncbi:hypothetical protein FHG87_023843 [Trinorchestia longiramus]|nr:hypothetical protein FHG87_023843 [Trinorchestia longiramus]